MYLTTKLGRLFYTEHGAAKNGRASEAIVLLHGYLFDGRMYRHQIAPLAELGRVVVIDGPGHGHSDVPPPFSLEDHADALADALPSIGIERAVFVGLSWGGFIAMRLALRHPDRVKGMALLNTSAETEGFTDLCQSRLFVAGLGANLVSMDIYRARVAPVMFGSAFRRAQRDVVEQTGHDLLGFSRRGLYLSGRAVLIERTNVLASLGGVHVKTLVVGGQRDRATPARASENLARTLPDAELAMFDSGHLSTLEIPDQLNAVLTPFVARALA